MEKSRESLASSYPRRAILFNILLIVDFALFATGIFSPLMTLNKMFFWENTVSVVSGIFQLIGDGHIILFIILFVFSIILPAAKIILLCLVWNGSLPEAGGIWKCFEYLGKCSKWAMLDVFVVAVIVVSVKLRDVAEVSIHYGVYLFMISIFITLFLTGSIEKLASSLRQDRLDR